MRNFTINLLIAVTIATLAVSRSAAADFDFYVLSLSWSPTYCEDNSAARSPLQCGTARPYGYIVHGLWPQYERGYPSYCRSDFYRPRADVVDAMMPIMPSRSLIHHQWKKHGVCSGLAARQYFSQTRKAFDRIQIPADMRGLTDYTMTSPTQVEQAFRASNPTLKSDAIAVTCDRRRLKEVRICLKKDLSGFHPCPEVDRRSCRTPRIVMPPTR